MARIGPPETPAGPDPAPRMGNRGQGRDPADAEERGCAPMNDGGFSGDANRWGAPGDPQGPGPAGGGAGGPMPEQPAWPAENPELTWSADPLPPAAPPPAGGHPPAGGYPPPAGYPGAQPAQTAAWSATPHAAQLGQQPPPTAMMPPMPAGSSPAGGGAGGGMLPGIAVAAALLLLLGGGGWWWLSRDADPAPIAADAELAGEGGFTASAEADREDASGDGAGATGESTPPPAPSPTSSRSEEPEARSSGCSVDPDAAVIGRAVDEVNAKYRGSWEYRGESNFDGCHPLTYAVLYEASGSAGHTMLLMFHGPDYLGVDSNYPQRANSISVTDDGFIVEYTDLEDGGDSVESVEYWWDGSKVAHSGRIPNTGYDTLG